MAISRCAGPLTNRSGARPFQTQLPSGGWCIPRRCYLSATDNMTDSRPAFFHPISRLRPANIPHLDSAFNRFTSLKSEIKRRWWMQFNRVVIAKLASVALLVAGVGSTVDAQSFYDLGFESPSFVTVSPGYSGSVDPAAALPGWAVFWGNNPAPYVLYDNMFLDSAGVSILDANMPYGYQFLTQAFEGDFTVLLQGGFSLSSYPNRQSVAIAQTGVIPVSAKTLLFDARMPTGETNFAVSIAGQILPFYALASYGNYILYALDISHFSGQTEEIRFTANPNPPPGLAINNNYLDDIRFSNSPLTAAPFILMPPANQQANMGSTVSLTLSATGYPAPAYQWFFNTTNLIAGATNSILELTNVQFSQSGAYTVVITNVYGVVTSPAAILTVLDPFIISQPVGQSATAGQTAFFSVGAGGTQPLSFQWLKNGVALSDGGNVSGAQTGGLTLSNILGRDAGGYSVMVSNSYSSVTSIAATLTVQDPFIATQPVSQTVDTGGTAVFNVVAAGTAPFSYQWFDAGVSLNDGVGISGAQSATLTLANVLDGEADAYWVVVSNSYGSMTSRVAFVSVNQPLFSVLHNFSNSGANPYTGNPNAYLVLSGRTLYGTAQSSVYKINTDGTGFTIITDQIEGANGGLVVSNATLYGTTYSGFNEANPYFGKVFKVNTDGSGFTVLKSFTGGSDGGLLWSAPVLSGSTLYGTTYTDGSSGYGTVFKVNTDGSGFAVLLDFSYTAGDPQGGLAISGNTLYGTLTYDNINGIAGKVFEINTDGSGFAVPKSFGGTDGREPLSGLVLSGATLYGTTYYGGTATPGIGSGTVFKVNTDGSGFVVLKNFGGGSDGANPAGNLVLSGSTLYGTTSSGGVSNCGTVFQVNTDGSNYTVLKRFRGSDGANPGAGLVTSGGKLYGTTSHGGIANYGVIFALFLPVAPTILSIPPSQTAEVGSTVALRWYISGFLPTCEWFFNGTNLLDCSTNCQLQLTNVQFASSGAYTIIVSNIFGGVTSSPVMLNVIPAVERRPVPAVNLMAQPGSSLDLDYREALGSSADWKIMATVTLRNASQFYFDISVPLPPQRFYRASEWGMPSVAPSLSLPGMVPAITLTGNVGDSLRVDYINQFGPTDAWVTLDTVTLTNTSQLYFDVSALGQPPRLWRIVPVP